MNNDIERVTKMARECGALVGIKSSLNASADSIFFLPEELLAFEQMAVKAKDEEIARLLTNIETHELGFKSVVVALAKSKKEVEEIRDKLAMQAEALLPFAENIPEDHKAPCHNGITTARKCGRCSRAYKAYLALNATAEDVAKWEATRKAEIEKGVFKKVIALEASERRAVLIFPTLEGRDEFLNLAAECKSGGVR